MSQIYSKYSFDRYGDDMSELILSYLPFDDKIRFECVSTQFCRLVYQKQYELTIDEKFFNKLKRTDTLGNEWTDVKRFKVFVKKLIYLKKVSIKYNTFWCKFSKLLQIIELIINCCEFLNEIEINFLHITDEKANKLFKRFGPYLTKVSFSIQQNLYYHQNFCLSNLYLCSKLDELSVIFIKHIFFGRNCLVKSLKKITFLYFNWDSDSFQQFIDCNKNSLQSIEVYFPRDIQPIPLTEFMTQLTKLSHLRQLKITFCNYYTFSVVQYLTQIAEMCTKLEDFHLLFFSESILSNMEIFNSMRHFKNLKKLYLSLFTGFPPDVPSYYLSQSLSECKLLTDLTLRADKLSVNDLFFDNIDKHLPNVRSLNIWDSNITGEAFERISRLRQLRELYLSSSLPKQIIESRVYDILEFCPNIRVIELENFETLDYLELKTILKYGTNNPDINNMIVIE